MRRRANPRRLLGPPWMPSAVAPAAAAVAGPWAARCLVASLLRARCRSRVSAWQGQAMEQQRLRAAGVRTVSIHTGVRQAPCSPLVVSRRMAPQHLRDAAVFKPASAAALASKQHLRHPCSRRRPCLRVGSRPPTLLPERCTISTVQRTRRPGHCPQALQARRPVLTHSPVPRSPCSLNRPRKPRRPRSPNSFHNPRSRRGACLRVGRKPLIQRVERSITSTGAPMRRSGIRRSWRRRARHAHFDRLAI
mmetsp:Transcript_116714/g.330160  ORF Transcript_116714/g.330160 Transcript_116714/m.330160 type:complete len:249 (-) Transcript_116714:112-858(-)